MINTPYSYIVMDPTLHYQKQGVTFSQLVEAAGLIPSFVIKAVEEMPMKSAWDALDEQYQHGGGLYSFDTSKFSLEKDGTLQYIGSDEEYDEPEEAEKPLVRYRCNGSVLYQYPSALVVFCGAGSTEDFRLTRMD